LRELKDGETLRIQIIISDVVRREEAHIEPHGRAPLPDA
jgi:hypothetical protein